jgi:L-Ala-D/L-Glu epimerase
MKITSITTTPVRMIVSHAPYRTEGAGSKHHWGKRSRLSPKRPSPMLEYLIVAIDTDHGVTGLGESPVDIGFFGETLEGVKAAVDDYLGPQVIGQNPFDREHLMSRIDFRGNSCGKAGIDLALHDLIGKSLGVPVTTLLGGKLRDRIPVSVEIAGGTPDEMANECLRFMDLGVRAFKPKIGGRPSEDAERLRTIRQAVGPTASIRADANQGYSPKEAILLCQLAEHYGVDLELLEQPVPAWDTAGMALVRRSVEVLIEADESCYTAHDALQLVRHEAVDVINIKIAKAGGLLHAKKIVAVAEAAGVKCVFGTAFGLGLEMAAKLHLAASTPDTLDAVEFTEIGLHPNLLAPPYDTVFGLPLEDGCLPVPEGPGLGVNLDVGALHNAALSPEVIERT